MSVSVVDSFCLSLSKASFYFYFILFPRAWEPGERNARAGVAGLYDKRRQRHTVAISDSVNQTARPHAMRAHRFVLAKLMAFADAAVSLWRSGNINSTPNRENAVAQNSMILIGKSAYIDDRWFILLVILFGGLYLINIYILGHYTELYNVQFANVVNAEAISL